MTRKINILAPEGVCDACLNKYSDSPIWEDLGHFERGMKISYEGFTHLNGCKMCFLKHPAVFDTATEWAKLIAEGDGIPEEQALQWVIVFYMGGLMYSGGKVVKVPTEEKILKKIKRIIEKQ